ncbi:MAG: ABC transporter ATP-binding protein/permease [Alphaproteobacteria bacterium]|nr:MAG: ABC transporter ATP-binding protein/permease [Alphaproteobacteria bacterium]
MLDITVSIYVPKMAKNLLEASVQNAIIWGVVWYSALMLIHQSIKYFLDLTSFPIINTMIQKTQFYLCKKWHSGQSSIKEGELLSFIRRIGLGFRMFYRHGVLNFLPALYRLIITGVVFYELDFLDGTTYMLCLIMITLPFFWLTVYLKTREDGWQTTDRTGVMIHEFLHQKNWNSLYQEKLEDYLNDQLKRENKKWQVSNVAKNIFFLKKELCIAVVIVLVFTNALLMKDFKASDFVFIQTHFTNMMVSFSLFFTALIYISEFFIDFKKIIQFLRLKDETPYILFGDDIVVRKLTFGYYGAETPVFDDFDLLIKEGEKVLLKGPNGAGKSTLIKILSGELVPSIGILQRPDKFIVIEQEPILLSETLRFHLTFALESAPSDATLKNTLKKVYLNMSLDKMLSKELSVGEKIKVLIARALLEKPDAIVLDESLRSLPKDQAADILQLLFDKVKTVIVISHDIEEKDFDRVIDLGR